MSKKLDDELAQAIGLADEKKHEDSAPPLAKPAAAAPPRRKANLGLLVTLLVMVAAVVGLFLRGFKDAAIYAKPVDDFVEAKDKLVGRKVRIDGELVPGTLVKRDDPCEYRFTLHGAKASLPVTYAQCVIPDTFRDVPGGGVQVTVEGALQSDGAFAATLVMAKCTSKYDPKEHKMTEGPGPGAKAASLP